MTEHGGPAYPTAEQNYETKYASEGMTLRQYYAAHAPNPPANWHGGSMDIEDVIEWRWYYADAMIRQEKL